MRSQHRRRLAALNRRAAALRVCGVDVIVISRRGAMPAGALPGCRRAKGDDRAQVMRGILAGLARRGFVSAGFAALRPGYSSARQRKSDSIRHVPPTVSWIATIPVLARESTMHHHKVQEVMTADPATVTPTTPLKHVAEILIKQNVSAVPVLSLRGRLLGIVAETDLLRKEELQRDPDGGHSIHLSFRMRRNLATAETAGEIMSAAAVTVRPDATVAEAARLMDGHHIICLPVTDEAGKLLGVVGPRELLRVFIRSDQEIAAEIVDEILVGYLGTNPALVRVEVTDGVVKLVGELERKNMVALIRPAVRAIDGVIDVEGELSYAFDDTKPLHAAEGDESPITHSPVASRRLN
jgi:CBS domain-containing protein